MSTENKHYVTLFMSGECEEEAPIPQVWFQKLFLGDQAQVLAADGAAQVRFLELG